MIRCSELSSIRYRLIGAISLIIITLLLSGCWLDHSATGSSGKQDTTIASIKITPGGLMFTNISDTQALSATAYNAAGEDLNITNFIWKTSKPDSVSVDANGQATSQTNLGSAMITAQAGSVTSTPLLVNIALPVPNAIMVNDAQVVGDIRPHNINEPLTLGSLYDVTLTGIAPPEVADILISTGSAPIAGRVTEVREANGQYIVTLEFVALDELFSALSINETLPIPESDIKINPALEASYNITRKPGGTLVFTPKQAALATGLSGARQSSDIRRAVTGTRRIISVGPFECKTGLDVFPLSLTAAPSFTLTRVFDYILIWEDSHKKVALTGTLTAERTDSWALTSSLTGKVTCDIEIANLPLPVTGWLSMYFGGQVPVGLGVEASGQISLTGLGFEMKAKTGGNVEAGFEVIDGAFHLLSEFTQTDNSFETRWTPPPSGIVSGLRLTPSLMGYAFANLDIGFRASRTLRLQVLGAKLGLNMTGNLALVDGQIEDTAYASDYKLSLDATIGPGSDITDFLQYLRLNLSGAGMTLTAPLSTSPKATDITADVESFLVGDTVEFEVELDPTSIDYLFTYNVFEVQIYRRKIDLFGDVVAEFIGVATAVTGQTDFILPWTASYDGDINDEFYAYVITKFLPFPYFESLELGKVMPVAEEKITFIGGDFGSQTIYVMDTTGVEQTVLVENIATEGIQAISPDGTKIAFRRYNLYETAEVDIAGLYSIDITNGTLVRLTASNFDMNPSWSPDGRKIVFSSDRDGSSADIYSINADGSSLTRLTVGNTFSTSGGSFLSAPQPVWSPDGTKITFESKRDDYSEIYIMNADGSNQTRLTFVPPDTWGWNGRVSWSPDGTKIVFTSYRDGDYKIYVMNADGSNQRQLTNNTETDTLTYYQKGKAWSPDGENIMFLSSRDGSSKIYIMNTDGSNQFRLANTPSTQRCPAWSPDGTKITFSDMSTGMYIINADGSSLTHLPGEFYCPDWIQ